MTQWYNIIRHFQAICTLSSNM